MKKILIGLVVVFVFVFLLVASNHKSYVNSDGSYVCDVPVELNNLSTGELLDWCNANVFNGELIFSSFVESINGTENISS